jgi:hypothetical protein
MCATQSLGALVSARRDSSARSGDRDMAMAPSEDSGLGATSNPHQGRKTSESAHSFSNVMDTNLRVSSSRTKTTILSSATACSYCSSSMAWDRSLRSSLNSR